MPAYRYQQGDRPLDGYTIQHALGRGGFGEVYFAVSDAGREVALKSVQNYEDIELRGIGHCMNLKSPHLVMIFDVKQGDDGTPWVIMEYVSGASMRDILDASPDGLKPEQAAFFVKELAKGIDYLHEAGIVHRDLKPHNVFFEDGFVKIGDYSLSKVITVSHASGHTMTVGSVHYMAPEISMGKYDKTVDLYALGVMLYEMLTGAPPFVGESVGEVLMKHLNGELDVSGLSEPFASVVKKAMDRDPAKRYQSAHDMAVALRDATADGMDESIPSSLSLVGQKIPIKNGSRTKTPTPAAPNAGGPVDVLGPDDLADTLGPANSISDTAESQPSGGQPTGSRPSKWNPQSPPIKFVPPMNASTHRFTTVRYLIRVALSSFTTAILMWLAFVISVSPSEGATFGDAFLMPLGVWPTAMLLAMLLVLVVPKEKDIQDALVSRISILVFWAIGYAVLELFRDATSRHDLLLACFLGTGLASLLMDWRAFSDERRSERILILRTLIAGAISGTVAALFGIGFGYGFDHVILAMASTMSAAITVQLVSIWDEPTDSQFAPTGASESEIASVPNPVDQNLDRQGPPEQTSSAPSKSAQSSSAQLSSAQSSSAQPSSALSTSSSPTQTAELAW